MSSADLKQQAGSAISKQQQLSVKIAGEENKLNGIDSEDTMKISAMQNKIQGLKSNHAGLRGEAITLTNEARGEEIKENKVKLDELNKEQEAIQKEESKAQQKLEKELEEKASKIANDKAVKNSGLDNDSGDELLFLSDDNGFSAADAEAAVTYIAANPVQQEAQGAIDPAKATEDDEAIKGAGASATGG